MKNILSGALFALVFCTPFFANAAGPNLIPNPDLETVGANALPQGWLTGGYGSNGRSLTYPVAGYESPKAVRTEISNYTSGDAKWFFNYLSVSPNASYQFSDVYRSNTTSYVTAQFKLSDGTFKYLDLGTLSPSSNWQAFTKTFTTPPGTVSLTIFHLIKSVGWVETDRYFLGTATAPSDPTKFDQGYVSIVFDDGVKTAYQNAYPKLNTAGFKTTTFIITARLKENDFPGYVKAQDVLAMQAQGHEIGAHTRTHPNLTTLSSTQLQSEVKGSRDDLLAIGATPVNFFAYPYGAYNSTVIQQVKNAGFLGGRVSDGGYNSKNQDKFVLRRQPMVNTTTFAQIKNYIDTARANKTWVILLFHQVDNTGQQYAVTPELFQQTIDYLKQQGITPITVGQGIQKMNQ